MPGVIPNSFTVQGGTPEKPAITYVDSAKFTVYMDADRGSFPVPVSAEDLAKSIVNDFCTTQLAYADDAGPAVIAFDTLLTEKDLTTVAVATHAIKIAKERQVRWYKLLVAMADDDWSRHRRHATISSLQREAAKSLKLEREWLFLSEDKVDVTAITLCPACKAMVVPGASICQTCRCVLNQKEAEQFQFAK